MPLMSDCEEKERMAGAVRKKTHCQQKGCAYCASRPLSQGAVHDVTHQKDACQTVHDFQWRFRTDFRQRAFAEASMTRIGRWRLAAAEPNQHPGNVTRLAGCTHLLTAQCLRCSVCTSETSGNPSRLREGPCPAAQQRRPEGAQTGKARLTTFFF